MPHYDGYETRSTRLVPLLGYWQFNIPDVIRDQEVRAHQEDVNIDLVKFLLNLLVPVVTGLNLPITPHIQKPLATQKEQVLPNFCSPSLIRVSIADEESQRTSLRDIGINSFAGTGNVHRVQDTGHIYRHD